MKQTISCFECECEYLSSQSDGCPYCVVIKCHYIIKNMEDYMDKLVVENGQLKQSLWPMKDHQIREWKNAYENMSEFAQHSGLSIMCCTSTTSKNGDVK